MNLHGIFPPLTTPFDSKGNVSLDKLGSNIKILNTYDLRGFLVLGSNGEFPFLSIKEKISIVGKARQYVPKEKILIAGTGCQSTRETIDLTIASAKAGADVALILNPFFFKGLMNNSSLAKHYMSIADTSPIPILIYNMPANTGIDLETELIVKLSKHQNIIGIKDSGANLVKMGEILSKIRGDFTVLSGTAGLLLPALSIGASGGILALANLAPQHCINTFNYFNDSLIDKASALQQQIVGINKFVTRQYGVPALKFAMDQLGLFGGLARKPLLPLTKKEKEILIEMMKDAGLESL